MWEKIRARVRGILKTDLVKVFSLTAISTLVKMLTALVSTKVVAYIVGPSGVALLGQLTNFVSIALNVASGGINNAITKYIAEYKGSSSKVTAILSTASRMVLWCALPTAAIMILFNRRLSEWIMLTPHYGFLFVVFGSTVLLYAINNVLISTINGFKKFRLYTIINILGSVVGLTFTVVLVMTMQLNGAMIATVTYQSVVLIVTVILLRREAWFRIKSFVQGVDWCMCRRFLKYSIGAIVFIVSTPFVQMLFRKTIMTGLSEVDAGIWEGMNRVSAMYMMIVSMSLTVYYIPRLAELRSVQDIRHEIIKAYKFLVPLLLVGFSVVYLLRYFIIWLLYTPTFAPMASLFSWQLILDFVKACSFVVSYLMIAKARIWEYTVLTLISSFVYLSLGYLLLNLSSQVVGIIQGELITQILYFAAIVWLFRRTLFRQYHK